MNRPTLTEIEPRVVPVRRLDLVFRPKPWAFAKERRGEIDAYFAALSRANPSLWNGRVLLLYSHALDGDVFRGSYLETDFASLLAWRDWGFPEAQIRNCFAMAAVRSADGAFLLGLMNDHTANAGRVYFPCGTPDPDDIVDGRVDLDHSLRRELAEETGLDAASFAAEPGWYTVFAGPRIAQVRVLNASYDGEALRRRVLAHLRSEPRPELADVRLARSPADLDPAMPSFVVAFLRHMWGKEQASAPGL